MKQDADLGSGSWNAIRLVLDRVNDRLRDLGWSKVTQEERDASNVDAFYGTVLNGGIAAIFFNSPYLGDMAEELLTSLERVEASRAAAIFKDSFAFFPRGRVPRTLDARVECLRKSIKAGFFEQISERFYGEAEEEEVILNAFFAKHPHVFQTKSSKQNAKAKRQS